MMRVNMPAGTRRWPIIVIAVLILLFIGFTVMSGFYVDLLWFREVKLSGVFWTVLRTKVMLGVIFGLLFFGLLYVNLLIVRWLTPRPGSSPRTGGRRPGPSGPGALPRWLIPLACAGLALIVGLGVSREWQTFLCGGTAPGFRSAPPSRSSIETRRSTCSRCPGSASYRAGSSPRSSA
jgi:uncharacterized membrane protein (UPF0182 family)